MTGTAIRTIRRRSATMAAVGVALVMTLAACGGTEGTPTMPSDTSTAVSGTAAGSGAGGASSGDEASDGVTGDGGGDGASGDGATGSTDSATGQSTPDRPTLTDHTPDVTGETSKATGSAPGPTGDASEPTSSTAPASFDAQTTAWFAAMCTSLTSVADVSIPNYPHVTDGGDEPPVDQTRTKAIADYTALHSGFTAAAKALKDTPPPTLDGGHQMAADVLASLHAMADVAADAPDALRAARTSTELASTMDDLRDRMRKASDLVPDDSPLTSERVEAAMAQIPECRTLVGG